MTITVTEYAKQTGTSRQAVYKKIKTGKLKTIKTTDKNGREINCIELDEPIKESPKTRQEKPQEAPGARGNDFIIKTLAQQLEAKDKQISALNEQIASLSKQNDTLTELLKNSQKLQGHTQLMLDEAKGNGQAQEPSGNPQEQSGTEAPKRKGLFSWLFD